MEINPAFYSGTSNIVVPIKQSDYPPEFTGASRLRYYASLFSSVEINASFYKIPKAATVEKWRESVPAPFRFTFKVPKAVTHAKGFQFGVEEVERFAAAVAQTGDKKGCLLVQLPPSVKREKQEALEGLLECLHDDAPGWKIAVEFRHNSWYDRAVYRLLQSFGATMVEQDLPASATPAVLVAEDFRYMRFHGPDGGYRGSYSEAALSGHAARVATEIQDGREVYVYFNNTMGNALGNLQTLNRMVAEYLQ
ncbi:MAG: DUF72 domain-containing protein [Bacteroidota bacterium]|nr:DUF72 domain-containing protein [Bacteroidota bacterium]